VTSQIGSDNPAADTPIPLSSRIRGIAFTNTTASAVFVGIYNSATPLTTGTAPSLGYVIRVPAGATLDKTTADFGEMGRFFANNTRIGLSSTFATYTPLTAPNLALCSLNLEIV
jgi:hypothetical protein